MADASDETKTNPKAPVQEVEEEKVQDVVDEDEGGAKDSTAAGGGENDNGKTSSDDKDGNGDEDKTSDSPALAPVVELCDEDIKAKDAIVERLSFFFSDANVRQDAFVRKMLMDKSTGGTVPFDVLLRFNTIKKHSEKREVLIAAAKELKDVLVVDESKHTVARVVPFTHQNMKENVPKSLYLQNLPLVPLETKGSDDADSNNQADGSSAGTGTTTNNKKYDVTVDEIREAFEKYGKVVMVKLKFGNTPERHNGGAGGGGHRHDRNNHHRGPKFPLGEAMIEFDTTEGQQKAAEATLTVKNGESVEPKDVITFGSHEKQPAQVKLLSEWIDDLRKDRGDNHHQHQNRGEKKRSRDDDNNADDDDGEPPLPTYEFDWKPGCVIRLTGLPDDSCDRETILDAVAKGLGVGVDEVKFRKIYADYSRGQTNGAIRFATPEDGIPALAKKLKDGEIKIAGEHQVSDAVILDGDEEKAYWQNFIDFKTKQIQEKELEKRAKKKQKRGGHGHGHGHGRGRKQRR